MTERKLTNSFPPLTQGGPSRDTPLIPWQGKTGNDGERGLRKRFVPVTCGGHDARLSTVGNLLAQGPLDIRPVEPDTLLRKSYAGNCSLPRIGQNPPSVRLTVLVQDV